MSKKRVYLASIIGEVLEWYDFSLYSFLSPILAVLFFPTTHPAAGMLGVFAIFAAGFLSRPLGGLFFGWLGDSHGRKSAFFLSLALMAMPTCLMGCLPTYQTLGFAAPLCLLFLRLMQGFSCGGEFSISMIFLSEHASKKNYYFSGSLAWMGMMLGALIASLVIMLLSAQHEFLMRFGWRIPFFIGGGIAVAGLYLRLHTTETPIFLALQKKNTKNRWYFIKKYKKSMLKIFLLNAPVAALSYVGVAFLPAFLAKFVGINLNTAFLINTGLIISLIVCIPIGGWLADQCSGKRIYKWSLVLLLITVFPAYSLLSYNTGWVAYLIAILCIAVPAALIKAVTPGMSVELAPLEERAVLLAFSYNVTYCTLGGTAPLLMSYLIGKTQWLVLPAMYIVFFAVIALFAFK